MADAFGLSDVSTPDTGKGSKLKTGGRRTHNMPSPKECASKYGAGTKAYKDCINYRSATEEGGTSAAEEQSRTKRDVGRGDTSRRMKKLMRGAGKAPLPHDPRKKSGY